MIEYCLMGTPWLRKMRQFDHLLHGMSGRARQQHPCMTPQGLLDKWHTQSMVIL